jgi:hypothetical protein
MTVPCPISDALDLSTGVASHHVWLTVPPPGPFPVPVPLVSWEVPIPMKWIPGTASHKFTTSVLYQGLIPIPKHIVQEGHNCGMLILDITPPQPANQWYAICWPFSKREIKFSASTVKMNGKAVGCTAGFRPIPMLSCGEPFSLPACNNLTNSLRSVYVGMTFGDFILGLVQIGVSLAIDAIFNRFGGGKFSGNIQHAASRQAAREASERAQREAIERGAREAFETGGQRAFKALAGKLGLTPSEFAKNMISDITGCIVGRASGQDTGKVAHVGHSLLGAEYNVEQGGFRGTGSLLGAE